MAAWQWLFLIEAIPALIVSFFVLFVMVDKPMLAKWLTDDEKRLVTHAVEREEADKTTHHNAGAFLSDKNIWKLYGVYFCQIIRLYGISFWLPSIIKDSGLTNVEVIGWLSAIPYVEPVLAVIALSVAAGILSALSLFWGIPAGFLAGINCVGNLAGFVSPYIVGWLNVTTHNNSIGLYAVAAFMIVGAFAVRVISGKLADR